MPDGNIHQIKMLPTLARFFQSSKVQNALFIMASDGKVQTSRLKYETCFIFSVFHSLVLVHNKKIFFNRVEHIIMSTVLTTVLQQMKHPSSEA
jgi:hypothetical protein